MRSRKLIFAMYEASKTTPPTRKTSKEWAEEFHVTQQTVLQCAMRNELNVVALSTDVPAEGTLPVYRKAGRGCADDFNNKMVVKVGKRMLRSAGLINRKKVAYRIDPQAHTITLSLIEKESA
jgi:hypothetical protein